jgi:hypothetical protein
MHETTGRWLIVVGALSIGLGVWLRLALPFPPIGRLPGDIVVHRGNVTIWLPITSMILVSAVVTVLLRWLSR